MMSPVIVTTEEQLERIIARAVETAIAKSATTTATPATWLDTKSAAKVIGVCTKTLGRLVRDEGLPAHDVAPGMRRYRADELEAWLAKREPLKRKAG